ncbi:ABC transporter ATP-binding protein [Dongia rigui]|uniref:ABC transporter ATP-binding protein n=1 Tax=Dongia rigui TaxID=940149 RepID=A0ABU5DWB7_9PROT|nr:ABC transporter ATP-binding protein [Dongia rigui]MDY0871569.1 ABC transporter ATP-binding protein [Dongia rigui]
MLSQPIIDVDQLQKRFGDLKAVDGLTFSVAAGQTVALLGGNGAGKTTTISMLLGLLVPTAGRISLFGLDIARHRHKVLGRMNFSSPYVDLPHRLSARENLIVFGKLYGIKDVATRIKEIAAALDLGALLDRKTGSLSAGQKTRVALGKALLNRPELLLLDEPTASLDPDTADWVRHYLESYQRQSGAAILLASHNMNEVERLAHEVLMLRKGKIVDRGTPDDLIYRFGRQNLEEVFLDIARDRRSGEPAKAEV